MSLADTFPTHDFINHYQTLETTDKLLDGSLNSWYKPAQVGHHGILSFQTKQ